VAEGTEGAAESRLSGRKAPLARAQVLGCVQRGILPAGLGVRVACGGSELGVQRDCGLSRTWWQRSVLS
jgi:hypothetical protein